MINMISESTVNSYKKVEKMWNHCSDNTRAFPKINKMERNYIYGTSGTQLVTSINFSTWMLGQQKKVLDGKK